MGVFVPIDVDTFEGPGWHLRRLAEKLGARRARLDRLDSYLRGDPPLPRGAESAQDAFRAFQRKARLNMAELVVEAPRERMKVRAFRTAVDSDETGDDQAWAIWKANGLTVEMADVWQNMLALGDAYVIVGADDDGEPVITGEDPRQVVTMHDPRRQSRVTSALKMFSAPAEGVDYAYVYLPGRVFVAVRASSNVPTVSAGFTATGWEWDESRGGELGEALPFDRVPVVRFRNRRGVGEFEPHLDVLDRINHMILQRMVIATAQAFKQRAIKGDLPDVDDNGDPIDYDAIFQSGPDALWRLPEDVDIQELGQADLTPTLVAVRDDLQHLAAVTRTPLSMISPDATNQSATGAALIREGLVFKVEDKQARVDVGLIDMMSLAFLVKGDVARAERGRMAVEWAPAERYSLAEKFDAVAKAGDRIPLEYLSSEVLQATPEQMVQLRSQVRSKQVRADRSALVAAAAEARLDPTVARLSGRRGVGG